MNLFPFRNKSQEVSEATTVTDGMDDLSAVLMELFKYGAPRVGYMKIGSVGWYSSIQMNVTSVGASFDIESDFGHATPLGAATECLVRVKKTIGNQA